MARTVVVDVGCHTYDADPLNDSTAILVDRFEPDVYYGFDAHPEAPCRVAVGLDGEPAVFVFPVAAWTFNGRVAFDRHPEWPFIARVGSGPEVVPCFDFGEWLTAAVDADPLVVKLNIEGGEYELLEHLHGGGEDALIDRLLVQWHFPPICAHGSEARRDGLLAKLRCPVEDYPPV
jgi:hypothetical protein